MPSVVVPAVVLVVSLPDLISAPANSSLASVVVVSLVSSVPDLMSAPANSSLASVVVGVVDSVPSPVVGVSVVLSPALGSVVGVSVEPPPVPASSVPSSDCSNAAAKSSIS